MWSVVLKLPVYLLTFIVLCYKAAIRPFLIGQCKFHPSCSDYALEAFHRHGAARGTLLAAKRICRCHPFGPGGIDPVPPGRRE